MATIEGIALALSELTGDNWTGTDGTHEHIKLLKRESDGLELMLTRDWQKKHEIRLSLSPAQYEARYHYSDPAIPEIGNSWNSRAPESVAKDIVKRLLADSKAMHDDLNERAKAHKAYADKTKQTQDQLGLSFYNGTASYYPAGGRAYARDIRVSGETVSMELNSITADQAWAVMEILKYETAEEIREYFREVIAAVPQG